MFLFERKDATNELEMLNKSIEVLKQRYENKQIDINKFKKKSEQIKKRKEKLQKKINKNI